MPARDYRLLSSRSVRKTWLLSLQGAAVALGYSILDEIHPNFVPGRDIDTQDVAGNLVGVILGTIIVIVGCHSSGLEQLWVCCLVWGSGSV